MRHCATRVQSFRYHAAEEGTGQGERARNGWRNASRRAASSHRGTINSRKDGSKPPHGQHEHDNQDSMRILLETALKSKSAQKDNTVSGQTSAVGDQLVVPKPAALLKDNAEMCDRATEPAPTVKTNADLVEEKPILLSGSKETDFELRDQQRNRTTRVQSLHRSRSARSVKITNQMSSHGVVLCNNRSTRRKSRRKSSDDGDGLDGR